ncbi:MAG: hypothetical protein U0441_17610 [Polyangiaceae bacterium]
MATERIDNPFAARRAQPALSPRGAAPPPKQEAPHEAPPARERAPLRLRAMTGYEEEVVEARLLDTNTAALCNEIVARCCAAPGADFSAAHERVRSLSTVDRDAALIQIRKLSLGDVVHLEVACPSCARRNEVDFKLSSLPLPVSAVPEQVTVELPDAALPEGAADRTAVARTPTAGDQEDLLSAGLASESARRTFLLARVLQSYAGTQGPFDEAFARGLPIAGRAAVERAIEAAMPDLDLSMAVQCVECEADFVSPFDVAAFFLPR